MRLKRNVQHTAVAQIAPIIMPPFGPMHALPSSFQMPNHGPHAPAVEAAAAATWEEATSSSPSSSLTSLPQGVLVMHLWPHLGPYARAQLRATC